VETIGKHICTDTQSGARPFPETRDQEINRR